MVSNPTGRFPGILALAVALGSAILGGGYYAYLVTVPSPPEVTRIVPFVWMAAAVAGVHLGVRARNAPSTRYLGIVGATLSTVSVILAAIFAMAALFGG